jgi:hypothetical protein
MIPTLGHRHIGSNVHGPHRAIAAVMVAGVMSFWVVAGRGSDAVCASAPAREADLQITALPGVDLRPVLALPGLAAASGPFPGAATSVRTRDQELAVWLESRPRDSAVDRPLLIAGTWARPGALVLGIGLAHRLRVRPGEHLILATAGGPLRMRVAGLAATGTERRTPDSQGVAYATLSDLRKVAPNSHVRGSTVVLELADSATSSEFAQWLEQRYPGPQAYVTRSAGDTCVQA